MFITPLQASSTTIQALSPLLAQARLWPFWLQQQEAWCLGVAPAWLLVQHADKIYYYQRQENLSYSIQNVNHHFLETLKNHFAQTDCPNYGMTQGFNGGLMGWLSYPQQAQHQQQIKFPALCFGFYDCFISGGNQTTTQLYCPSIALSNTLNTIFSSSSLATHFSLDSAFVALMNKSQYQHSFNRVQQYLLSGDCYQVNLAQAFKAPCTGLAYPAFERLLALSNAPYAAYSHSPFGEILSLSPELFLAFTADGSVLTRPIKGTRPRKADPREDQAQYDDLAHHPKDKAENLMIVDLLRHDLGKHAVIGSVKVPKLFSVESFAQVHHLISDISCQLKAHTHPLDVLFDAFPGGSITGAPKKRAMEIIAELENCDRAIYCGSVGYLNKSGDGVWNIAIRTLLRVEDALYAWAGGGIVADSVCESEYEECFNKIGAMLKLLEDEFLAN